MNRLLAAPQPRGQPSQLAVPAVVAVCAVAFGGLASLLNPSWPSLTVVATASVLAVTLAVRARGGFDLFEPVALFFVAYAVIFVVRPIAMIINDDFIFSQIGNMDIRAGFGTALLLGLIGSLGFSMGYLSSVGRQIASSLPVVEEFDEDKLLRTLGIVACIGVVLFLGFIFASGGTAAFLLLLKGRSLELSEVIRGSSKYFYYGPLLLIPAAISAFAIGVRGRRPLVLAGGVVAAGLLLVVTGPTGSRGTLLPLVGGLFVLLYLGKQTRPSRGAVALTLLLALATSSVVLNVRQTQQRENGGVRAQVLRITSDPGQIFAPILTGPDAAIVPGLAAAVTVIPSELPHTYGLATFGDFLFRPIPRGLWPAKPQPPREQVISVLTPKRYADGVANPEFSSLFVFYMDFGLFGPLALAAVGVLARALWEYRVVAPNAFSVQLLFSLALPFMVFIARDGPVDTAMRVIFILVPLWVALRWARTESH